MCVFYVDLSELVLPDLSLGILASSSFAPAAMLACRIDNERSRKFFPLLKAKRVSEKK